MLSLNRYSCHQCRSHLDAYLHLELPQRARRRVAQHLGACPACYMAYVEQRNLSEDVKSALRYPAQMDPGQRGRIWRSIQADMNHPTPVGRRTEMRFGAAAIILMLTLLLPWSLDTQPVARALPLPPQPVTLAQTGTPVHGTSMAHTVALRVTDPAIPPAETPAAPLDALTLP